jgi:hypothetical protein
VDVVIGQVAGKFTPGTPSALLRLALHGESLARCAPDEAPERASAVELFAACVREARWDAMWGEWGKPQD